MSNSPSNKKPIRFGEDQLVMIDQGLAEFERGEGMTIEEAQEMAKKRTEAWMKATDEN